MSISTGHQHRVPGREGTRLTVAHAGLCHMRALAGALAITSHCHIEGVQVAAWDGRLPTPTFSDRQDQQAEEQRLGRCHGYHFQGPGTEWFAEWVPQVFCWSPDSAGSLDFYLPAFWSHALLEISLQACLPARGLRAIPPGRSSSSLRCGPQREASAFCCLRSRVGGSEMWKKKPGAGAAGSICVTGERDCPSWAAFWPPGLFPSLLCDLGPRHSPVQGLATPTLKLLNSFLLVTLSTI